MEVEGRLGTLEKRVAETAEAEMVEGPELKAGMGEAPHPRAGSLGAPKPGWLEAEEPGMVEEHPDWHDGWPSFVDTYP